MMGVGKSTIGRLIAKKLKAKFIDVDKVRLKLWWTTELENAKNFAGPGF